MGSGFRTFQSGEVLTAANVQDYLMDQSVQVFAGTAALGSAIGTAVEPGMVAYLTDSDQIIHYRADAVQGTAWQAMPMVGGAANVVINGAMQVAQRGTSTASITTSGYYTADRFQALISSAGTWTQTVESDAPTGSGFRNSLKMLCTTADASPSAGDLCTIRHNIEGQNVQQFAKGASSAKQFALSFWVKSNVTGTYVARLFDSTNTRSVSATYTVSASATWEKKSIVFPADTSGAIANNNNSGILIDMWLVAGSNFTSGTLNTSWASETTANVAVGQTNVAAATNNYWQITGVQLEAGSVATPFEFEDYGTTLLKCERYYQEFKLNQWFVTCSTEGTAVARCTLHLRTRMRAAPGTITLPTAGNGAGQIAVLNASGGYPATIGTHAVGNATETQFNINIGDYTAAWLGAGVAVQFYSNGASTISCSAEL